jgi:hypothetical protein
MSLNQHTQVNTLKFQINTLKPHINKSQIKPLSQLLVEAKSIRDNLLSFFISFFLFTYVVFLLMLYFYLCCIFTYVVFLLMLYFYLCCIIIIHCIFVFRYIDISKYTKNRYFFKKVLFLKVSENEEPLFSKDLTFSI